jgi:capsular exopolysaccharide synthesis family protein
MDGGKVLMVTSVQENEGKSTVAANIALTLVRKGKKVLLIDCDLHKPACATLLEVQMPAATTRDVLLDQTKLSSALVRYKRSDLYLILEKRRYANSGDLLTSHQMHRILDWARREFDFVVLDMPPMNVVSDSEGVADLADASLLVVRQNAVRALVINRAVADLENGKAKLLGCILNDMHTTFLSSGQGYRYGNYGGYHGYGHYGSYGYYGSHSTRK